MENPESPSSIVQQPPDPAWEAEVTSQMSIHMDFLLRTKWDHLPEVT